MNGLLILDKPAGMTSQDVVALVRRATGERAVGHLGTLDPMATGVLPLLLGRFTRLAQFFSQADKAYTGTIRFGFATDTFDVDGQPTTEPQPVQHSLAELQTLASAFRGEVEQMPPVFSAKKINGVPAHRLARAGKEAPVKAARITIHDFALTSMAGDTAAFTMSVSSGGYVRSVAHELGQMAGVGAHLSSLRRTRAGVFTLADSVTIEALKVAADQPQAALALMPHPREILREMPAVTVDERTAGQLRNGLQVNLPDFSSAPLLRIFTSSTDLLAIGRRIAGSLIQPAVVLG